MSFAERHKIWLLPLLILAAVAVLWHNLSGGQPRPPRRRRTNS